MAYDYSEPYDKPLAALRDFLKTTLRLTDEEGNQFEQLLDDYVKERADHSASKGLDREFNRGDWRRD